MVKADKERFAIVLGLLGATFKNEVSSVVMQAYFAALGDLTIDQVEHAGNRWLATGKFFPKPIELRELAAPDTTDYEAGQAWQLAVRCVTDAPYAITFTDPLINAVIRRLGGRATFARIGATELERFWRPRFCEEYKRLRTMDSIPSHMVAPLPALLPSGHITRHDGPHLVECDYVTHKPAIEHLPDNEEHRLLAQIAISRSVKLKK